MNKYKKKSKKYDTKRMLGRPNLVWNVTIVTAKRDSEKTRGKRYVGCADNVRDRSLRGNQLVRGNETRRKVLNRNEREKVYRHETNDHSARRR